MRVVHERCCGLDVHKRTVVACVLSPDGQQTRTFGTMTRDLLALGEWLQSLDVGHVAMESTGVFWQPIYNVLEDNGLDVLVANARHIKAVPGRKTDVKDAEWIADLLRHGLIRGSSIPSRARRELRELVRYRLSLSRQRAQVAHRIHKVLEGANIKLSSVLTDIMGVSGRAMVEALITGADSAETIADLARGPLRRKHNDLVAALEGLVGPNQRLLLASHLRNLEFLTQEIERLTAEIEAQLRPSQELLERLDTIPGVGPRVAQAILAEIGTDVSRFPTGSHLASWARVCPSNDESAGKRRSSHIGPGNPWLRATLVEAAWAATHAKHTYLATQYRRLAARRGAKRALVAVAHTILIIAYRIIRDGTTYEDLGSNYFDERDRRATLHRSIHRLERLGYKVTVEEAA
jgi:transposase